MSDASLVVRSDAYKEASRLMRELATLAELGRSQTPEARSLRLALDVVWNDMSEREQETVEALSADLYFLAGEEELGPPPTSVGRLEMNLAAAVGDWMRVAVRLAACPRLATGVDGLLLRACCWSALGESDVAERFAQRAADSLRTRREVAAAGSGRDASADALARPDAASARDEAGEVPCACRPGPVSNFRG